jgi:hypothetical protein
MKSGTELEKGRSHGRMARGIHGLPKVSPGPAMLHPSVPCGWATTYGCLLPFRTPHTVRLWSDIFRGRWGAFDESDIYVGTS